MVYDGNAFPTPDMIDQKWTVARILGHPEFDVRLATIREQTRNYGYTFGVAVKTTAKYIRVLHACNRLPDDIRDGLVASGFLFSEEGEMKSCSIDLYRVI